MNRLADEPSGPDYRCRVPIGDLKNSQQAIHVAPEVRDARARYSKILSFSQYMLARVAKAKRLMGLIAGKITAFDSETVTLKTRVRPILECCFIMC